MKEKTLILLIFLLLTISSFAQIPSENLQLWLRADSVEIIEGKVARWYDLSDNDFEISQSIIDNRPVKIDYSLNNHPIIQFDGANDYFYFDFAVDVPQPNSFFVIWETSSTVSPQIVIDGTAATGRHYLGYYNSSIYITAGVTLNYSKIAPFSFLLSTIEYNTTDSKMFENGILIKSGNSGTNDMSDLNIGKGGWGNTAWLNGSIAEIIIYDSLLTTTQKLQVENYLMDKYAPPLNLGADINIDYGFCDTSLIIDSTFTDILWSTGESNDTIFVSETGEYFVEAKDIFGRMQYDTINVQLPIHDIQNTYICLGDSVLYDANLIGTYDYLWADLSTDPTKNYKDEGDYWLRMEDTYGCFDTLFFTVDVDSFKNKIWLGNDTSLCSGNTISLINGEELCSEFLWTPSGSTETYQFVSTDGWQKVNVENIAGCEAVDSIYVTIIGVAPLPAFTISNLCFGDNTSFIDSSTPIGDIAYWQWVFNENDTIFTQNAVWQFETYGTHDVQLVIGATNTCVNDTSFVVEIREIPQVDFSYSSLCSGVEMEFISDVTIPNGTDISFYSWLINGLEVGINQNFSYTFTVDGEYELELLIFLDNGCINRYLENVIVLSEYLVEFPLTLVAPHNAFVCAEQSVEFQWNNASNSIANRLLVSVDYLFEDILFDSGLLEGNSCNVSFSASYDTIYWKVLSTNPCNLLSESSVRTLFMFNPNQVDSLQLWLTPDSLDIVDNKVATWHDLSHNAIQINQSNIASRPSIIDNTLNHNVLSFDGINDFFYSAFPIPFANGNSLFVLWKVRSNASLQIAIDGTNTTGRRYLGYGGSKINIHSGIDINYSKEAPFNYIVSSIYYNSINSKVFENNTLKVSGNTGNDSVSDIYIGKGGWANTAWLNGDIAEVIFYNKLLDDSNSLLIRNYLFDKYSPPVNLLYDIRIPTGFCDTAITTAYKPWFTNYEWSTGETDSIISVSRPGVYTVTVTDIFGFESSDDIRIFYPEVNTLTDTLVCFGELIEWDTELSEPGDYTYEWYGSVETTEAITISTTGEYAVIIEDINGCKYYTDTINFGFDNYEFTASIGPEDTLLCAGNRLLLIENNEETANYNWSTGSTDSEITITETGEYSVSVTSNRGCEAVDTINVTINGVVPVPLFESLGHCAQNPIDFTDLSTSSSGTINSWTWSINGEEFSTEQNPQLGTPSSELGIHDITLVISTDEGCSDFVSTALVIYALPEPSFTPNYFCQNVEIEFVSTASVIDGSIANNSWDFNGAEYTGATIIHAFPEDGTQTIKLISTSDQSCADSISVEVFVNSANLPVFEVNNTCLNELVYFINNTEYNSVNPPVSWSWNFDDGNSSEFSNPEHTYTEVGTYDAELSIVFANGCNAYVSIPVEIYHNPQLALTDLDACVGAAYIPTADATSESGSITDYSWTIGDPIIMESVLAEPEIIIADTGKYLISLEVGNSYGCKSSVIDTLEVHENPQTIFTVSRPWGAVPLWVDFVNQSIGAENYYWDFDGENFSIDMNPYFIFTDSGSYEVKLISYSEFACTDTAIVNIKSVIPLMDIILYDLRTTLTGNYLQTKVYIINNGTLPVENLELELNLGDGKIYREVIDYFAPSQVLDYSFTLEVYVADGNLPNVVCVEAVNPTYEIYTDVNLENNIVCNTDVEELQVMQPYPNPASDIIYCEFILAEKSDVVVSLVNTLGEIVYKNTFTDFDGYKKLEINVKNFANGVYFLQVRSNGEMVNYKIEIGTL